MSKSKTPTPRAAGKAAQKGRTEERDIKVPLTLQPTGSLPFFYSELGRFCEGTPEEFRVGVSQGNLTIYFFIKERIVAVSVPKLCEALAPHAVQLVKEG